MLKVNDTAPLFRSLDQNQQLINLSDYLGEKNVVLFFYPKDDTPGCTIEAKEFTDLCVEFEQEDTVLLGVSKDNCTSHVAFINKYHLKVELLADTDGDLCEKYGVWQEVEKDGEKKMKIIRSTFLIDKQGSIREAIYHVSPEGHPEQMLEKVRALK